MDFRTPQEQFWAGSFGAEYMARNAGEKLLAANIALFCRMLGSAGGLSSVLELGANIGMNLHALRRTHPGVRLSAVEINPTAAAALRLIEDVDVHEGSIADFQPSGRQWDLVFTKGVLIHIHPDLLASVYDTMAASASRYVLMCEYYNPTPVAVPYRGYDDRLFKRDFAGEFLERHSGFSIVDYGFVWRHDPVFPQDDCTWFLLRRGK